MALWVLSCSKLLIPAVANARAAGFEMEFENSGAVPLLGLVMASLLHQGSAAHREERRTTGRTGFRLKCRCLHIPLRQQVLSTYHGFRTKTRECKDVPS